MPTTTQEFPARNPDVSSLEETEELIRQRAYRYYEQRGCENGHDLDDWLRAELEIVGTRSSDSETAFEALEAMADAAA